MVSWEINPATGAPPYVITALFRNAILIDGVNYAFRVFLTTTTLSCDMGSTTGSNNPITAASLLTSGRAVFTSAVPVGSCRSYTGAIYDLVNGTYISVKTVWVSNL